MSRRRVLEAFLGGFVILAMEAPCFPISRPESVPGSAGHVSGQESRKEDEGADRRGEKEDVSGAQHNDAFAGMRERARELTLLQNRPLAKAVLARYPALRTVSPIIGMPPRDGIVVQSIEKPEGSECKVITVWRREYLVGYDAMGGGGGVVEDLWGVLPDGNLRKMGSRPVGQLDMSSFYRLDAQVLRDYLYRCVKVQTREAIIQVYTELTMLPVPAFRTKHDPPLVVPINRVADLPGNLPANIRKCFLSKSKAIATVLTIPREAPRSIGIVDRECLMFTSVEPLWAVADLVCIGYVFSKENDLRHTEVLYHQQCGSYWD